MYPYAYVYRGKRTILIWQTSDIDTFALTSDSCLLQANTLSSLKRKIGAAVSKVHWTEYAEIDCDKFFSVLKNLKVERASSTRTVTFFSRAGILLKI